MNVSFNNFSILFTMPLEFYFQNIKYVDRIYSVQGKLNKYPLFFVTNKDLPILSFIIQDINGLMIECVAFGPEAKRFNEILEIDKVYSIKYANTINNNRYIKTNHKFKLLLNNDSEISKLKIQKYSKANKICIKSVKIKKSKDIGVKHQLSITNFFKTKH